jgi:uncharacterized membrane protein YhaH (DUF805 family)
MRWMGLLFGLRGRVGRARWWAVQLAGGAVAVSLWAIDRVGIIIPLGLLILAGMVLAAAVITNGIRRLHDRDRNGWWLLLFYVAPVLLDELAPAFGSEAGGLVVEGFALAIVAWAMIEIGCLPGSSGPNRYGADPLAGKRAGVPAMPRTPRG